MNTPCAHHDDLMAWVRRGEGAPLAEALERHVVSCADCAREHGAIVGVRERLQALPVRRIDPKRLGAIRFELIAAARSRPTLPSSERPAASPPPAPRRLPSWRIVALLSAAVGLLALVLVVSIPRGRPQTQASHAIEIELADGANGVRAHEGPDEVYALLHGSARFHVRTLHAGERFRVVVGGDTVEVRGTRFRVDVADGRMVAVDVQEGAVALSLAEGGDMQVLTAGHAWHRAVLAGQGAAAPEAAAGEVSAVGSAGPESSAPASSASAGSSPAIPPRAASAASAGSAARAGAAVPTRSGVARVDERPAFDAEFGRALDLVKKGRAAEAAAAFDRLRDDPGVDAGRRADALYWAARAHTEAGHGAAAEERARAVTETPGSWHGDDAALLLGEALMKRGDIAGARPLLERAARSARESIRTRALRALQGGAAAPAPTIP